MTARLAFGYMLEPPRIPRYRLAQASGDNATGADNQQERPPARKRSRNPQRLYAERLALLATRDEMMGFMGVLLRKDVPQTGTRRVHINL